MVGVLQIWNHEFFWESMSPDGGGEITGIGITDKARLGASYIQWLEWPAMQCNAGEPSGELKAAIDKSFGSFEEFKKQFSAAGATQFGMCTVALLCGQSRTNDALLPTGTPFICRFWVGLARQR